MSNEDSKAEKQPTLETKEDKPVGIACLAFTKDYRCFKKKHCIFFMSGVNLLVGENGCGKSTILSAIAAHAKSKAFWKKDERILIDSTRLIVDGPRKLFCHDFIQDNPQTSAGFDMMGNIPMEMAIGHMRLSHGQSTNAIISMIEKGKDMYMVLDEPDSGLSPKNAVRLAQAMKNAASNGCQIIASVHNPWVIEFFNMVFNVEDNSWMKASEYLKKQLEEGQDVDNDIPTT